MPASQQGASAGTSATYKLTDIIKFVNDGEFLKYIPNKNGVPFCSEPLKLYLNFRGFYYEIHKRF